VVDNYSKYITANELIDSSNTNATVFKFEVFFCLLGDFNLLVSDNGPQFVSDFNNFCQNRMLNI